MKDFVASILKALVAAGVAGAGAVATALQSSDGLTPLAWTLTVLAALTAFGATYATPNAVKPPDGVQVRGQVPPGGPVG